MSASPPATLLRGRRFEWGRRTYVVGVLNLTTDSFSGDGLAGEPVEVAVRRAAEMQRDGADLLDVGGESTRPGFAPVSEEEELSRVMPVLERLLAEVDLPLSVDTMKGAVARAALRSGASLINDVNGLRGDPALAAAVGELGGAVVVMHNQRGRPHTDVIADARAGLDAGLARAAAAGIDAGCVIVDPGFGFGWSVSQNMELLRRLGELRDLGHPVLVGTSRKSSLGAVLDLPVDERLEGTAATVALSIANGADLVRVHDVRAMARVARMSDAVVRGWREDGCDD